MGDRKERHHVCRVSGSHPPAWAVVFTEPSWGLSVSSLSVRRDSGAGEAFGLPPTLPFVS